MAEFQLILLAEVNRPARKAGETGTFSLIPFRDRSGERMVPVSQDDGDISPEALAAWWTPREAVAYASRCEGIFTAKAASNAIWQRLVGGLIESASASSSSTPKDRGPTTYMRPDFIPKRLWKSYSDSGSDLWGAGDARFFVSGSGTSTVWRFFGIRLNPDDVRATLPSPRPPPKKLWIRKPAEEKKIEPQKVEVPEPVQKGPAVAEDHLKAWHELYRRVYTGVADTEANALASAQGMFQGKSVSRDRVRALRGTQKRGRKSPDTAK
jgi:hypothetical protein